MKVESWLALTLALSSVACLGAALAIRLSWRLLARFMEKLTPRRQSSAMLALLASVGWDGGGTRFASPQLAQKSSSREPKYHQILSKSGSEQNSRSRKPLPKFEIGKSKIL